MRGRKTWLRMMWQGWLARVDQAVMLILTTQLPAIGVYGEALMQSSIDAGIDAGAWLARRWFDQDDRR